MTMEREPDKRTRLELEIAQLEAALTEARTRQKSILLALAEGLERAALAKRGWS